MSATGACVVDASVALQLFLPEDLAPKAEALLTPDRGGLFWVPELFFAECASAIRKATLRARLNEAVARECLRDLLAMEFLPVPLPPLAESALDISFQLQLSAYDAFYVAAARELGIPLVTADQRLSRAATAKGYQVVWLGDV